MPVEDVEVDSRHEGVAQRVLLVQESGVCPGFDVVPGAPFVHDQADALFRIVFIHDGGVFCYQFIHLQRAAERFVPFGLGEFGGEPLWDQFAVGTV